MHIKQPQSSLLSNHEVLLHFEAEQIDSEAGYKSTVDDSIKKRKPPSNLREILKDGLHYLRYPDYAVQSVAEQHPERPMTLYKGPNSILRALAPRYRLNKAEYLQIYNIRPRTQITLQLIIEESGTRFSEEELEDILATITRIFDEEESAIPEGVEHLEMERLPNKLLGASKKKRKGKRKA